MMAMAFLGFCAQSGAEPTFQVNTKIVREYEENGESKRMEFSPTVRFSAGADGQLRVNDQNLVVPRLENPDAQEAFAALMRLFSSQAAPLMSKLSTGQPFQVILEVPTLHEKLDFEMTPRLED